MNRTDLVKDTLKEILKGGEVVRPSTKQLCELLLTDDDLIISMLSVVTTICFKHPEFYLKIGATIFDVSERLDDTR